MADVPVTPAPEAEATKPLKLSWMDYAKLLFKGRSALESIMNEGKLVVDTGRKSGVKTLGFWMTVLSSLGAVAAQAGGLIPQPYGAIILAASSLFYSISRGVVKNADPLGGVKPALTASESWVNILASVGQVAMASSGAVSPEVASILVAVHAAAVSGSQALAASGAQPNDPPKQ